MSTKSKDFTYAVARIRCKEGNLLSAKHIEQMISMKDAEGVKVYLSEKGWSTGGYRTDDIIFSEERALWDLMQELVGDISCFDFIRVQSDFQNLKACIKSVYSDCDPVPMFVNGSILKAEKLYEFIKAKDYASLPVFLAKPAQEAIVTLLHTGDGRFCDVILDKACVKCVLNFGKESNSSVVKEYCEVFTASANIRIALRCSKLRESADFIMRALSDCDSLDNKSLALSATEGINEICGYLSTTPYKDAAGAIKKSISAFEKWCDDYIIRILRTQRSEPFTIGPLVAYIVAKQTEMKAVRLILTAKNNGISDSVIRERIRDMYA